MQVRRGESRFCSPSTGPLAGPLSRWIRISSAARLVEDRSGFRGKFMGCPYRSSGHAYETRGKILKMNAPSASIRMLDVALLVPGVRKKNSSSGKIRALSMVRPLKIDFLTLPLEIL